MSTAHRAMLELVAKGWVQLEPEEQQLFRDWLLHAHGEDLYMLLRHARRQWQRGGTSSSQTFEAVREHEQLVRKDNDHE